MRKFFTRLLMMVFLVSVMFHVYAAGPPVADPLPAGVTLLWPEDGSTTQALPGTDNVFVLKFTKDLHETAYFGAQGVIALSGYASQGIWQVDPILLGNDGGGGKVTKVGPREVHISFNSSLLEDSTYHITIEEDAIRFADGEWFGGVVPMQWNFTVKDVTPPQMVTCDDANNVNGLFNVSLTQDPIAVCFSEPVWWAAGADPMKIGNIAFYTAAKAGLDPNDEFGGDVIYEKPNHVVLYNNDMVVYNSLELKAASIVVPIEFDKVEIWLKGEPYNGADLQLKHAAIGDNVWPVDRDIYLRFAAGLLVDKGGNEFAGINGSPFDPYNVSSTKYWFSTRLTDEIPTSARAVANTSTLPGTTRSGALWSNDDIVVEISNGNLEIKPNTAITNSTVSQFIKLSIDGSNVSYTVKLISVAGGTTSILIEPGTLPEKKQLKVDLLGDKIQDKGDLRVVEANSWTFNTGDYTAPMITASVNNILCTNFDLRVNTDENGVVFYAVVKEPVPTHWDAAAVTPLDVVRGYRDVVVGSVTHRYYFYHVDDAGATYGPATTADDIPPTLWVNDNFNITPSLTAFEKVLNFTEENHGDKYRIYYFAHDPNAQGPYNNPAGTPNGRVTGVSNLPVQLTDCLEPEIAWFFEGVNTTNDPLFDACEDEEDIKKQGKWKLDFTANPEGLYLEFDGETWDDVIILEVSTDGENYDVVERTITPIEVDGKVVGLTVTPLNSYPSGGHVMITLLSGSVRDAAGNTINEDLICEAHVQNYDDPWVKKFTVETKSLMHPDEFPMLDGVAAKKNGKITIEFNNPMYTPKRDETGALPVLVPISEDPAAENYIGKYVKLRVGALEAKLPSPDATVTSDIVSDDPFTFVVTRDSKGGITKIVATPKVNYASETWYFVDLEQLLQDENRVDLTTIDNNNFTDPHDMYSPNADNYFIQFRSEDSIAPVLRFVFEKYDNSVTPATVEWPYIADVDEDEINCISYDGFEENGAPIGAIITEWSEMGFDEDIRDYYINTDPNGLRPYFKLMDSQGNELPFDVVVLRVYEPDAPGSDPYRRDAVWFGFVPFVELEEGDIYTMEFMPTYQAPGSALAEGPVFVDDNGNALIEDTYVSFMTCSPNMLPVCLDPVLAIPTTVVDGKNTAGSLTPSFTVTFPENIVNHKVGANNNPGGNPSNSPNHNQNVIYFTLTGGNKTWSGYSSSNFVYNGYTINVPFSTFTDVINGQGNNVIYAPPANMLDEKTEYTLTITAGVFYDRQFTTLENCTESIKFWTPDLTAPMVSYLSPDKIVDTNNNLGQSPYAIDPRNPGRLIIGWDEKVTPQAGKLVEVWQNGTTKRLTFTMEQGTFVTASNRWWVQLPADFLQYNSNFHVDVQEGFVKDPTGNISARLTGFEVGTDVINGDGTWTFSTGADSNPTIIAWTPICMVEPGNMHTQPHGADSVKINKITITLSEKATPVAGKNLYVEFARGGATLRSWNVSSMTSTDQLTWTITPNPAFIVANNDDYIIYVEEGAFAQTYSANSLMSGTTPDYEGDNFLSCEIDGFDTVIPASFAFSDTSAPTARIWPENGNVKIPFNAHGYVRFTESLIAFNSMEQMLVVTQNNIKNWIKVWKYDAAGANPTPLASDEYVVEFVNPERTHARITFHDPEAPAIDGYTYNLQDEWDYAIVVNAEGDNGYWLQDMVGNILFDDDATVTNEQKISKFRTEDITAPNFYVTTCNLEPEKVQIKITPWMNEDPYGNDRDYPAEGGKAYYVVRPAGTAVTAANLFNKTWSDVAEVTVPAGGVTVNWTLPAEIRDDYNYTVYVVMQDAESDLYVATAYNNAWVTADPIFIASGDANPATGAIGIADIRPAPNKNMAVKTWNFCFCDDDQPLVVSKEWNQHMNVPVDETFEIEFNEFIQPGADVILSGEGTGGTIMTPDYGYEVRLREWDNNVAVPIRIKGNGTGTLGLNGATGIIITPGSTLDEETKYYIEIDRWVVWDVAGSNCDTYENVELPDNFPAAQCTLCSEEEYQNNFPGWIGRNEWWFKTTDNTAPILTAVSPLGSCVPVNNNQIVFTFQEKNEMVIKQLAGINTNSIYIYKEGSTIPYEVIPASSGAVVRTGTDTWTITYTTLHPYNSEEVYSVEWNKGIFVDNAIPVQHNYTESLSAVVDGQTSAWHKFSFTSEDNLKPVANWAFMNRLWVEEYDDENLAYPLAIGSYDSNDILAQPVDVCDMYQVPQFVGAYVWFNEPTALTAVTIASGESESSWKSRWMNENFYLTTPTGTISLKWISNGNTGGSPVTLPNGAGVVPANTDWYYIEFNGALASLGEFDFGIKAGKIKDVNATNCRVNTLDAVKLFNFCVWDATAPTAQLFDGAEVEILNVSANNYLETCVEEGDYFRLKFSKPVVKTSAIMMPPQFGNPVNPFWWTYDNLYLTVADLMDNGGPIYSFENVDTEELVEIMAVEIVVPGQEYKIFPKYPLVSEDKYEFVINEDVLKDMVRIPNGNFFPGKTWEFIVTDWEAPYITSVFPADEAVNISPVSNLTITFNEEISLGTSERIIIRDNGTNGLIYSYRADDWQHVTRSPDKKTVTINHDGLNKNDMYYVQVEPGFVKDASCKFLPFEGKFEQGLVVDTWNFKTGDIDGPVAMLWPTPGDDCVEIDANLVIRFDENITLTDAGKLVIYKVIEGGSFHNPMWPDAMFGDVVAVIPFTYENFPQVKISGSDAPNGLTDNIVTVTPPLGLWESKATYYVRIVGDGVINDTEADVVVDAVGNSWAYPVSHSVLTELPGIHHNQWYFTIGNNDEPVLVSMTPEWGETVPAGVASASTDLTMTFEEEVAFGSGAIKVYEFIVAPEGGVAEQQANLWMEFNIPADVASGKVSLSADMKTVTVHDVALLDGITWYYVLVEPGAITNNIECTLRHWEGISNPDTWLFHTAPDVTDPVLEADAVTSDACSEMYLDPSNIAIELHFSEPVSVANGTGLVEIMEDGEVVASATITAAHIEGSVVTLSIEDFDNPIEDQKMYTIVIGGDAIHDRATASLTGTQNPFGLVPSGNENWYAGTEIVFHTGDFTAPVATNFEPNMVIDLENDVTLKVWFSEPVQSGTGKLILTDADSGQEWEFMAEDAVWSADMMMLSYEVELPDETSYFVTLEEGFVMDMVYMDSCDEPRHSEAVTDEEAWTFAIDDNTVPSIVEDLTEDVDNLMMSFQVVLEYDDIITYVDASKAILWFDGYPTTGGVTGAEIGTDPTTVIIHVTAPQDQTEYMLQLLEGFVWDDAINPNASLDTITGPYYVGDRTAPILEAAGPTGILPTYIGVEVFVDFFDDSELTVVAPITIEDAEGDVVATWTPVLDAEQADSYMLDLMNALPYPRFGEYTVTIPAGAVVDVNGNEFAGFTWTFAIIDNTPPDMNCLTIVNPEDGDTGVLADVDLIMEFCERMAAGDQDMLVKVYEILEVQGQLGENTLFYSTPVTTAMVNLTTVTIPLTGLKDNTSYIVLIDDGALTDEAGNAFGGIYDPTVWNFTTGDNTPPTVVLDPASSTNDKNEIVVIATFSEEVVGAIEAIMVEGAEDYEITTTDDVVFTITITAADSAEVTITVPVTITDIADAKGYGNPLAEEVSGTYVVGDNTAPTVTITTQPAVADSTANEFMVVLTFSEKVDGVEAGLAGSVGIVDWDVDETGTVYTLYFEGLDNTELKLHLDSSKVTDVSENANELVSGLDVTYKVGCNNPEIIEVTIDTYVGEEVIYVNEAKNVTDTLGVGVHTLSFDMENGCTGSIIVTVTENMGVLQATIAEIQGTGAESPVVGKTRGITGTVTGVVPGVGYYVQDANAAWSGIFVADATTVLFEGNGVHVEGVVSEVNGVTTLTGTGTVVNPVLAIVPIVLASPELAKDEMYESVLVQVKGVRALAANAEGLWDVYTETTKVLTIGKWMYTYVPEAGKFYDVTGIVNGANWWLQPRKLADIDLKTNISVIDAIDFKVYPNPFNNELNIDNYDKLTRVTLTNIAGQRVIDVQYPERVIRTANLVSGVYVVTLFNEDGIVKSERIVKR